MSPARARTQSPEIPGKHSLEDIQTTISRLSLEEKIGQMLQIRCYADYPSFDGPEYLALKQQVRKYHVGSVVIGMHFDNNGPIRSSALETAKIANQLQRDSELPLLVSADLERGVASRIKDVPAFPWPMTFGATANLKNAERFGAVTGRQARAIGINWAFAPVADVNSNPSNPIINDRSFGEDPEEVGKFVVAFINGAHSSGLLVTAKHFPGHGDSAIDSHRGVAAINGDLVRLGRVELPPFKKAIDAGVDAIMPAHASVPALDPGRIATLSPAILTDLLKKKYGFSGLIVTDALEMEGVLQVYAGQPGDPTALATVDAVKAGNDVISVPRDLDAAFNGILKAVRSGEIREARIDESVRKILEAKAKVGLDRSRFVDLRQVDAIVHDPIDEAFAQEVADSGITLVRNKGSVLPLEDSHKDEPGRRKTIAIVLSEKLDPTMGLNFERELKWRDPAAAVYYFDGKKPTPMPAMLADIAAADKIIVLAYVTNRGTRKYVVNGREIESFGLVGPSRALLHHILATAGKRTAVVALGSPYLIEAFPEIQTYLCTYAMASTSEVSVAKAIFGELRTHGRLPVTLPGIAERGTSLPWPSKDSQTMLAH